MLIDLQEDGSLAWHCTNCGIQTAHINHEEVQWHGEHVIAMPQCTCCKGAGLQSQTFLKVAFTPQELTAPNMIDPQTGQPTDSHVIAHRHMALAEQLKAIGKVYTPTPPPGLQPAPLPEPEEIGGLPEEARGL